MSELFLTDKELKDLTGISRTQREKTEGMYKRMLAWIEKDGRKLGIPPVCNARGRPLVVRARLQGDNAGKDVAIERPYIPAALRDKRGHHGPQTHTS